MQDFLVEWAINLTAETHEDAMMQAIEIVRDPNSAATVWHVTGEEGDMRDIDGPTITRATITHREAQELHEIIGVALEILDPEHAGDLARALEIAALVVSDTA